MLATLKYWSPDGQLEQSNKGEGRVVAARRNNYVSCLVVFLGFWVGYEAECSQSTTISQRSLLVEGST